jgi:hypothetical protein
MSPEVAAPATFDGEELAEYIEIYMLVNQLDRLSRTELRRSFPANQGPTPAQIDSAFTHMKDCRKRGSIAYPYLVAPRSGYPYGVVDEVVVRTESQISPTYDFMLFCSMENAPLRFTKQYGVPYPLFDAIVREASAQYLGPDGRALIFAWPPRGRRPSDFSEAVSWVGAQLGIPDGDMDRPPRAEDAGVDVISCRPFGDGRNAFLIILYQTTTQADFVPKARDVVKAMWQRWLKIGAEPGSGLAIPFAVHRDDDRWQAVADSVNVFLDRMRITQIMRDVKPFPELAEIREFNADQLRGIADGWTEERTGERTEGLVAAAVRQARIRTVRTKGAVTRRLGRRASAAKGPERAS